MILRLITPTTRKSGRFQFQVHLALVGHWKWQAPAVLYNLLILLWLMTGVAMSVNIMVRDQWHFHLVLGLESQVQGEADMQGHPVAHSTNDGHLERRQTL